MGRPPWYGRPWAAHARPAQHGTGRRQGGGRKSLTGPRDAGGPDAWECAERGSGGGAGGYEEVGRREAPPRLARGLRCVLQAGADAPCLGGDIRLLGSLELSDRRNMRNALEMDVRLRVGSLVAQQGCSQLVIHSVMRTHSYPLTIRSQADPARHVRGHGWVRYNELVASAMPADLIRTGSMKDLCTSY